MSQTPAPSTQFDYALLERQTASLLEHERHFLANTANFAALIFSELPDVNWAGFYFPEGGELVLGPFCGKPACTRLPANKGVCAAAATSGAPVVVEDVTRFAGHITCDSASRSEIALPLLVEGRPHGVFDIDSPLPARFTQADRDALERIVARFVKATEIPRRYGMPAARAPGGLSERTGIQTCRDHHVVVGHLAAELDENPKPAEARALLRRLKTVLLAHLKLEDDWLYPSLTSSDNAVVRGKAEKYRREMGGLKERFVALLESWAPEGAIENRSAEWIAEWGAFSQALRQRMATEDNDLYVAAEEDLGA